VLINTKKGDALVKPLNPIIIYTAIFIQYYLISKEVKSSWYRTMSMGDVA